MGKEGKLPAGAGYRWARQAAEAAGEEGCTALIELSMLGKKGYCVAVDFDGTLCTNAYPEIGKATSIVKMVKILQKSGIRTILWTCRTGQQLDEAAEWCRAQGLVFSAINDNTRYSIGRFGDNPRKVSADEYWDDRAINVTRE